MYFAHTQQQDFYIDFEMHRATANELYYVPKGHFLYLPFTTQAFYCITLLDECLTFNEKRWLYYIKYEKDRKIILDGMYNVLDNIKQDAFVLSHLMDKNVDFPKLPIHYLELAEQLIVLLSDINCAHSLSVPSITKRLAVSEKHLQRVCRTVFECTPHAIIRFQLTQKILYYIIFETQLSFTDIATKLYFNEISAFNRYVKSTTQLTPKQIRNRYRYLTNRKTNVF